MVLPLGRRLGWQAEKRARLVEGVAQAVETTVEGNEVQEIAMLPGGGVGPFAGGALAMVWPAQADKQAAASGVGDIANEPVAALTMAVGEIVTAHCLGIARETAGQIGGMRRHDGGLTLSDRRCRRSDSVPSIQRGSQDRWCWSGRTSEASK